MSLRECELSLRLENCVLKEYFEKEKSLTCFFIKTRSEEASM